MRHKIRGLIGVKSNDGHDAPILVVADILKQAGIEVVYGGYDLTARKFAQAAVQEGVHFVGISSYNGGHIPFFRQVRDELKARHFPNLHIIGGGGATITPEDVALLEAEGIDKIFRQQEGHLAPDYIASHYDFLALPENFDGLSDAALSGNEVALSYFLNTAEEKARLEKMLAVIRAGLDLDNPEGVADLLKKKVENDGRTAKEILAASKKYSDILKAFDEKARASKTRVIGVTGRGGSGKSTLIDQLVFRYMQDPRNEKRKIAIFAVDPTHNVSGGALLADRMSYAYATDKKWVDTSRIYIRSFASRGFGEGLSGALPDAIRVFRAAGYDILVETYGTGQADSAISKWVDQTVFVTTPDFGGEAQMRKEALLDLPETLVVLNKNDLTGALRASSLLKSKIEEKRLFLTTAAEQNDPGLQALYERLRSDFP